MKLSNTLMWLAPSTVPALGLRRPMLDRGDVAAMSSYYPCHSYYLDSNNANMLWSSCPDIDQDEELSSLDLNRCLINDKGTLKYVDGGGDAMKTCSECSLSDAEGYYPRIKCRCRTGHGDKTKKTTLDLMEQLYNSNGYLACFWAIGDRQGDKK
ncbi:hypothetical protein BROUX41_002855 [Berkeleyomyces rouxiae]|uniref:uncharacterized protein n=1 Tax=Berkeleyomyces rouxiae TaxID=2035830 RepID=UPI003B7CD97A